MRYEWDEGKRAANLAKHGVLIYTRRRRIIRLISLRQANKREREYYEKTQA